MIEATIFEFLYTIPTEPLEEIGPNNPPLRTFTNPPTPQQVGFDPYALVEFAPGIKEQSYFGGSDLMNRLVLVGLYQSPDAQGKTPNRLQLMRIWNEVSKAVHHVDEDITPGIFVKLYRQAEQEPMHDPKTKGLYAAVRFSMRYFRQ